MLQVFVKKKNKIIFRKDVERLRQAGFTPPCGGGDDLENANGDSDQNDRAAHDSNGGYEGKVLQGRPHYQRGPKW